jgi:putative endonuclease
MVFEYVLKSLKENRLYIGMAENVERRLQEHNSGKTKSTKGYRPWELVAFEEHPDREAARSREKYLKSGSGREYIKSKYLHK